MATCVQIAAGVMLAAHRWLPKRSAVTAQGLLVAGGAAGSIQYAVGQCDVCHRGVVTRSGAAEQRPHRRRHHGGGLIAVSIHSNATYFGVIHVSGIDLSLVAPGLLVTLFSGLAGGLFSRLLIVSLGGQSANRLSRLHQQRSILFAAACGVAVAAIGIVTSGATFGSGYTHTRNMLEGSESAPAVYVLFKFIATWLTA